MTTYRVTATLNQKQLIDYLDANRSVDVQIEVVPDLVGESTPQPVLRSPVTKKKTERKVRAKRGSKVVQTILETLRDGGSSGIPTSELKSDLERAGLSANSLSTGLAILQKDGKIKRTDTGSYTLADAA
jgi:hypothetical protein